MAAIVYDGIGGGGELFEGIKLYILQRVPSRNTWKELVESNGGEVIKIDSQADYVIADHVRKDNPLGALSWKWIEQCVKKGELLDIEEYRAAPATKTIREVGSGQPTRHGRTKFSAEDDRLLMNWVTRAERQGASILGNELYKQLERKNDRHTYQSWRDRWVKHLQYRPRPNLDDGDESPPPEPSAAPARRTISRPTAPVPARNVSPQPSSSISGGRRIPVRSQVSEPENGQPFIAKSKGGDNFTKSDRRLLLDAYDDILNLDEDQIIDAWSAWAVTYPAHTAQEWRNYFTKTLVPKVEGDQNAARSNRLERETDREEHTLPPIVHQASGSRSKATSSNQPPAKALEFKVSQGSSGKTLESQNVAKRAHDPTLENEMLFGLKVEELAKDLDVEVDLEPSICGQPLSLFRIWQVVMSVEFGGSDEVTGRRLWPRVAKKLNFNDFKHKNAAQELKACYEEFLSDFEEIRSEYLEENPDITDSQEADTSQLIENQLMETAARDNYEMDLIDEEEEHRDDDLDPPRSSAPRPKSNFPGKRNVDSDRTADITPHKKPRIDKGKGREIEIPSTPENIIWGTQAPRQPLKPSPLKGSISLYPDLEQEEDDGVPSSNGLFVRDTAKPKSSAQDSRLPQHLEPETQDFYFATQNPEVKRSSTWISLSSSSAAEPPQDPPRGPSAEESTQSLNEPEDPVDGFIEHWVSLGYHPDVVVEAIEATTLEIDMASLVMESLTTGTGIPNDMKGVWTTADDKALEAEDESQEFKDVLKKHGWVRVVNRRRYLQESQELEEEE